MKARILLLSAVLAMSITGCRAWQAYQDADMSNPADVNDVNAAAVEDVNDAATTGKELGEAVQAIGVLVGKPEVYGLGTLLLLLAGAAGGLVEKERRERKES